MVVVVLVVMVDHDCISFAARGLKEGGAATLYCEFMYMMDMSRLYGLLSKRIERAWGEGFCIVNSCMWWSWHDCISLAARGSK